MNKLSAAGRLQIIIDLLGGQPQTDDYGNILLDSKGEVLLTPQIISPEEAKKLLQLKDE